MNLEQAIQTFVAQCAAANDYTPSHCTTRCALNDLTADNPRLVREGYSQDRAFRRVRRDLAVIERTRKVEL